MAEKSQNADSGKEIKEKKKRQHNNRKVFRLCRQTLKIPAGFVNVYYNSHVDYSISSKSSIEIQIYDPIINYNNHKNTTNMFQAN